MILIPLLMALAAPGPNDRLFKAPEDVQHLREYDGQPIWGLMLRCATAHYELAVKSINAPYTTADEEIAETYGITVEEVRGQDLAAAREAFADYLRAAINTIALDRGLSAEEATAFVSAAGTLDALPSTHCAAIRNAADRT